MKKFFVLTAAFLMAIPAFGMDASFKTGDGSQSRLLFEVAKNVNVSAGIGYMDLHGKVGIGSNEASLSGSALIPSIGVEYSMPATKNVSVIVGAEYQQFMPSFEMKFGNNSTVNQINDAINDVLKDTNVNCISVYTGVNVKLAPSVSLNGTTGIRLLNGSYSKDGVDLNLGINSVYTQLGILVSL